MPTLPQIKISPKQRLMTDSFRGLNMTLNADEGELYDSLNLTLDSYPLLTTRNRRGLVRGFNGYGGITGGESLAWVEGGTLYYNALPTALTGLAAGSKSLIRMGAYICVFPDKKYYNTVNSADYGSMEASYASPSAGSAIRYEACYSDGTLIGERTVSATEPTNPDGGDIWVNSGDGTYYEYSSVKDSWVVLSSVFVKITFTTSGQLSAFNELDGVMIDGARYADLNGAKIIYALGGSSDGGTADFVVLSGVIAEDYTDGAGRITIRRTVPELDFVCECQNRLWGCYFGNSANGVLNEIYCSALGDFRNWNQYLGVATDSWTASVGSDGEWTGCINYLGYPTFFKEKSIHRVVVSSAGSHQLTETPCRGVQKGSDKSLQIVGETLYYKSIADVCAWQGGFPVGISEKLGDAVYTSAVGGVNGSKYYLCMKQGDEYSLFVYDTAKKLWIKEDSVKVLDFATVGTEIYAVIERETPLQSAEPTASPQASPVEISDFGSTGRQQQVSQSTSDSEVRCETPNCGDALGDDTDDEDSEGSTPLQSPAATASPQGDAFEVSTVTELYALNGSTGTLEAPVSWRAESGIHTLKLPDSKYVSRFDIRLRMEAGATAKIYLMYDSSGVWVDSGTVTVTGTDSCMIPVRPRRCDHFRIKLEGTGSMKLFSIARYIEESTDY